MGWEMRGKDDNWGSEVYWRPKGTRFGVVGDYLGTLDQDYKSNHRVVWVARGTKIKLSNDRPSILYLH